MGQLPLTLRDNYDLWSLLHVNSVATMFQLAQPAQFGSS